MRQGHHRRWEAAAERHWVNQQRADSWVKLSGITEAQTLGKASVSLWLMWFGRRSVGQKCRVGHKCYSQRQSDQRCMAQYSNGGLKSNFLFTSFFPSAIIVFVPPSQTPTNTPNLLPSPFSRPYNDDSQYNDSETQRHTISEGLDLVVQPSFSISDSISLISTQSLGPVPCGLPSRLVSFASVSRVHLFWCHRKYLLPLQVR